MTSPQRPMLGIIGGTGMAEALGSLGSGVQHRVDTPFGPPSSPITVVEIAGAPVALLPRHGDGHRFPPSQVPYRANIFALKAVGVTHLVATFFDDLAVHVEFAQPFCHSLRKVLLGARSEVRVHGGGTYVCMEGPQFS